MAAAEFSQSNCCSLRKLSLTACCLLSGYTGHCWQHLLSAKEKFPNRVFTFNCIQVTLHPQTSLLWLPTNQNVFGSQVLVHITLLPENYTKEEKPERGLIAPALSLMNCKAISQAGCFLVVPLNHKMGCSKTWQGCRKKHRRRNGQNAIEGLYIHTCLNVYVCTL